MNIKLSIAAVAAFLLLGTSASAQQQKIYNGQINVTTDQFRQKADSIHVEMTFDINGLDVKDRHSLELIPVIESKGTENNKSLQLPSVNINGRNRQKMRKREMRLNRLTSADYGYYTEIREKTSATVDYRCAVPYEPWMTDAKLNLLEDMCGCGGVVQQLNVRLLAQGLTSRVEPYRVMPTVVYLTPQVEEVKRREASGEAFLTFPVSRTEIRPELGNNQRELDKIRELIEGVRDARGVTIRGLSIIGWASPEGTLATNKRLSEGRATSLKNYVVSNYQLLSNLFSVQFGGENWIGLRKAIEASDASYKQVVLDIIDLEIGEDAKEARLKKLHGGVPYREMLNDIFPQLRRVDMVVDYNVVNFSLEEAREVFRTHPQNLSLNEMFILANSYGQGTPEFNDIMETACRIFPADDTANLNAAASALSRGDAKGAEQYMAKVKVRNAEYTNNMGVMSLLNDDLASARNYFQTALNAGITEASANLEEVDKRAENIEQIEEQNKWLER